MSRLSAKAVSRKTFCNASPVSVVDCSLFRHDSSRLPGMTNLST